MKSPINVFVLYSGKKLFTDLFSISEQNVNKTNRYSEQLTLEFKVILIIDE